MALQLAVHIFIVQFAKVIGKPLVPHGQQSKKGGFPGPLTAHQTKHDLKLAAGVKCPADGPQQEQPQGFIGVLVAVGPQKVAQAETDALFPVPHKAVQIVPDGVVAVGVCRKVGCVRDLFLAGQAIGVFQIQPDILHVRVGQGAGSPFPPPADGL